MDVTTIEAALERLNEGLAEARSAAELLRDGDVTAMGDLDSVVDAMALKTHTNGGAL